MFGGLKSGLKQRLKGVVEDIKGRRVDAAEPYVAPKPQAAPPARVAPVPVREPVVGSEPVVETVAETVAIAEAIAAPSVIAAPEPVVETVLPVIAAPEPVVEPAPEPVVEPAPEPVVEPAPEPIAVTAPPVPKPVVAPAVASPAPKPQSVAAMAAAAAKGSVTGKALHADQGSTDLDAYLARAKANGRDVSTVRGGTGINVADDGTVYWGPVDNDSSRAKAAGKLLSIDQFECISCGTCVEQTDKVYVLPDDGKASPIAQDGPMDLIQDAIDACPVTCISWVTPEEAEERGLATGVER